MGQVVFVVDESGAKGYSDNMEMSPGEIGVMAGYFVSEADLVSVKSDLDMIRNAFLIDGKVHIAELGLKQQELLRERVFAYFFEKKIPWVYEAIYVQGFFENAKFLNQLTKEAHELRSSNIQISWQERNELLHSELFLGLFGKSIEFCSEYTDERVLLNIITDVLDAGIMKKFKDSADALLHLGQETTRKVTGFDKETSKVVSGKVVTRTSLPADILRESSRISYTLACEDSSLTMAADVLVNSVNHYLKKYSAMERGSLNVNKAISEHPLKALARFVFDGSKGKYFSDAVYMHPDQYI
jgi:hypothetical protein